MTNDLNSSNKGVMQPLLPHENRKPTYKRRARIAFTVGALALFGTSCIYLSQRLPHDGSTYMQAQGILKTPSENVVPPGISFSSFQRGLDRCQAILDRSTAAINTTRRRHRNPRAAGYGQLLIRNGRLWLGDRYKHGDILIENGLIAAIDEDLVALNITKIIDAAGQVVTPGIIDMHSHMTVDSFPGLAGSDDTNEYTDPITPYVRVIDALNPTDPALKIVASGGITTSLILPGSANQMGGEAAVIKLRPVPTLSVEDMLIGSGVTEEDEEVLWRYMKMACGENPKANYGYLRNVMPISRLGEGYLFRKHFEEAQVLKRAQDDWCDVATRINQTSHGHTRLTEGFPESVRLESLVALLRGETKLNIHCYLPQDFEAMIHHSLEFDFEIAAFHHALSAWQVPEIIKRAKTNITIATFGDMWGYKTEALNTNVYAPQILAKAGIPVAFKSDHPVMNSRDVIHEAQKAYHYGYDEHLSLAAMTSVPANALGLGHRLGSIEVGKDADLVIWARHPLRLGARPKHVIVDGIELDFDKPWAKSAEELLNEGNKGHSLRKGNDKEKEPQVDAAQLPPRPSGSMKLEDHGLDNPISFDEACRSGVDSFVLRNIGNLYMSPKEIYEGDQALYVVVENGTIACAGPECDRNHVEWPHGGPVFDMNGGTVMPGIISSGVALGLMGIQMEASTLDGYVHHDLSDPQLGKKVVRAVDGIKMNSLRLQKAYRAGVTTSIPQPLADSELLNGLSVAFGTGAENTGKPTEMIDDNGGTLDSNDTIIKEETAIHFKIFHEGGYATGQTKMTVSQQIAAIRDLLASNVDQDTDDNVLARAAQGKLPVVIETHDKDEIASIVNMKHQLYERSGGKYAVQFVVLGGTEAHLVAEHLQRLDIPVILTPARCYPATWQQRQCLSGPPLTPETGLDVLLRHGVRVGLASTDPDNGDARNLIFEAGWNLAHNRRFTPADAVGLVTWNIADIFGLQDESIGTIRKGGRADFVAYNSSPFEFGSRVLMVHGGGRSGPFCFPKQI
ncbi:hypothetical protein EC973_002025 [Apophysomyces ossiformis]|uniref:Amidohydrolase-related domain-containing protein n=1 Tax=Apophysomyces ossiformis TaxID=679940 RepID=A0A8H7BIV1_9FUNG|nr:hypothetical protein EC973_002025 [Apophysomyces ossiformis]